LLVAVALLPVALLGVAGLEALGRQQHARALQGLQERARAIASAVDLELQTSVAALEVLALSSHLARGDLAAFHAEAKAAADFRVSWDSVLLTDTAGRWVLSTRDAPGAQPPGRTVVVERASFDIAVATRRPALGNIARGPRGRHLFPVRVPVVYDGKLRYIVNALVDPSAMLQILERQKVHAQSLSIVFDARHNVVASTRDHNHPNGVPLPPSLLSRMGADGEGSGVVRTEDGGEIFAALSRIAPGDWGVALGVERELIDAPLRRSYAYAAAALLLSLAAGALAAAWFARRIAEPMGRLREAALAAGRGELRPAVASGIPEIDEVSRTLADAVRDLVQLQGTLEARVAERTRELAAANEQLESFSYSVSHDLRAPLRAVDGFAALLLREAALPEAARARVLQVRENAQRMGLLIDGLLAFSRLSRQPIARQRIDMAALARDCLAELRPGNAEVALGALPEAQADPLLLHQVMLNLLGNALKYSSRAAQPRVQVGAEDRDGTTAWFVRDNGVGFDMKHAAKLFGVFHRLHAAEEFEGTGVGLAIVQRIVQRHGGRVWAEAAPGEGATFWFTLGAP
jgi:signal transduction histidine kinase